MNDDNNNTGPPVTRPWRRRLRLAWTVFFGVLIVALCVLWVRSYETADRLQLSLSQAEAFAVASKDGSIIFIVYNSNRHNIAWKLGLHSIPEEDMEAFPFGLRDVRTCFGFGRIEQPIFFFSPRKYFTGGAYTSFASCELKSPASIIPDWFALLLCGTLAAFPWLPFRFSLRTMLVVTTLVAVVLGLAVWSVNK